MVGVELTAYGGAGGTNIRTDSALSLVELAVTFHQAHTRTADCGAIATHPGAFRHFRHSNALIRAVFARLEAGQARLDAGLHRGFHH